MVNRFQQSDLVLTGGFSGNAGWPVDVEFREMRGDHADFWGLPTGRPGGFPGNA